ncbi:putative FmdB family regulatory protein [Thermodesulfitimonas autotrophica]|uniref:Putative FmdB family regulatory protein n=1 Tax=Thermodesulfitimonas autotrophica TaxID=1894989 RepID=A0A3N5BMD4_9THEO|nr:zinc ribbon domain-containing protein [Thermodesulfitimonas autotrophica]RPF46905.1 putative FmdB family regulatory protein [Thermodesulfitimonas autotrophica]
MPQYEFECRRCAHRFTVLVSWAEKESVRCPKCGSSDLKQIWSPFSAPGRGSEAGGCRPTAEGG